MKKSLKFVLMIVLMIGMCTLKAQKYAAYLVVREFTFEDKVIPMKGDTPRLLLGETPVCYEIGKVDGYSIMMQLELNTSIRNIFKPESIDGSKEKGEVPVSVVETVYILKGGKREPLDILGQTRVDADTGLDFGVIKNSFYRHQKKVSIDYGLCLKQL